MKPAKILKLEAQMGGTIEAWHTEVVDGKEQIVIDRFRQTHVSVQPDPRRRGRKRVGGSPADPRRKRPS